MRPPTGAKAGLWLLDIATGAPERLTFGASDPVWSPDGRELVFADHRAPYIDG